MDTIMSADGRYEIAYHADYTGWVQVVEYNGFAPRLEVRRSSIPFEMIATLMDKMLFNNISTAAITVISEPSKHEFESQEIMS